MNERSHIGAVDEIDAKRLRAFIERIERLEEETTLDLYLAALGAN